MNRVTALVRGRGQRQRGREGFGQILRDGIEIALGRLQAIILHLHHQRLETGKIAPLLGGAFRIVALRAGGDHQIAALARRQLGMLVLRLGRNNGPQNQQCRQSLCNRKQTHDMFFPNIPARGY
jgi:hypothetical protein